MLFHCAALQGSWLKSRSLSVAAITVLYIWGWQSSWWHSCRWGCPSAKGWKQASSCMLILRHSFCVTLLLVNWGGISDQAWFLLIFYCHCAMLQLLWYVYKDMYTVYYKYYHCMLHTFYFAVSVLLSPLYHIYQNAVAVPCQNCPCINVTKTNSCITVHYYCTASDWQALTERFVWVHPIPVSLLQLSLEAGKLPVVMYAGG